MGVLYAGNIRREGLEPGGRHEHTRQPVRPGAASRPAGRRRHSGALRRRLRAAIPVHGRGGVYRGPAAGGGPGGGVRPLVLQRAPRGRLQVAGVHRRVRGRPGGRPRVRRPGRGRARRRRGDHLPQHHRGAQPPRLPAAAGARRRRRHHRGRAPRQPAALVPGRDLPVRRVRAATGPSGPTTSRRHWTSDRHPGCWPSPARPTSPAGCRRSSRSSRPPTTAASPWW